MLHCLRLSLRSTFPSACTSLVISSSHMTLCHLHPEKFHINIHSMALFSEVLTHWYNCLLKLCMSERLLSSFSTKTFSSGVSYLNKWHHLYNSSDPWPWTVLGISLFLIFFIQSMSIYSWPYHENTSQFWPHHLHYHHTSVSCHHLPSGLLQEPLNLSLLSLLPTSPFSM